MSLKVVHINREAVDRQAKAREFWETVLKPKWEAKAKEEAERMFSKKSKVIK